MEACALLKRALTTGDTGQAGAYLIGLLAGKGFDMTNVRRRSSYAGVFDHRTSRIRISDHGEPLGGDPLDLSALYRYCKIIQANEFYGFAAKFLALRLQLKEQRTRSHAYDKAIYAQ